MVHMYDSLMFPHLLKVKVFHTDDAIVLAHKASKTGQFAGQLGALHAARRRAHWWSAEHRRSAED